MLRKGSIATKESTQSLSLDTETLFPSPLSSYCLGQYFPLVSGDRLERVQCVFQFLFLSHSLNFFFSHGSERIGLIQGGMAEEIC